MMILKNTEFKTALAKVFKDKKEDESTGALNKMFTKVNKE